MTKVIIKAADGTGAVEAYHNANKKLETTATGAAVTGNLDVAGKVHITDDLDDGQLLVGTSTSDATTKYGTFNVPHKTNSEEPVMVIGGESTTSNSQNVYIGGGFSTQNACKQILFYTAADTTTVTGTERVKITTTGNVNIANGNLAFSTAGKGIDFSATSGAGTQELFDDYEEGVFTPSVYGSSGTGSPAYAANAQWGRYTKVGRVVHVIFDLTVSSWSGASGTLQVGMPFAAAAFSTNEYFYPSPLWMAADTNYTGTNGNYRTGYIPGSSTALLCRKLDGSGNDVAFLVNQTGRLAASITYITDS